MNPNERPQVLLLYPKTGFDLGSTVAPPHSLLAIAAPVAKAGYRVKILDQRTTPITVAGLKESLSSDLICVGISTMTGTQIGNALQLARAIRRLTGGKVPIVWGGPHPTTVPEQTVADENVDIVVVGEGDETFLELVRALEQKATLRDVRGLAFKDGPSVVLSEPRPLLDMETLLPTPWELIDASPYIHHDMYVKGRTRVLDIGQTSRGCPFNCGFCSSAAIRQRKWRPMSVEKSLDLIRGGVRRFQLDGFWLRDDEFYINRKRAHEICLGMIHEKLDVSFYTSGTRVDVFLKATDEQLRALKQAGAHTLKFGAESGSQRVLDLMCKGIKVEETLAANRRCKEFGFVPAFAFVVGYPTETFDDINQTIDLIFQLKRENPQAQMETIATYTAVPGTPGYAVAMEHGLKPPSTLEGWVDWVFDDYDPKGVRIPWFNRRERIAIGNLAFLSILSNAFENIMGSMKNPLLRLGGLLFAKSAGGYFRWRLRNKHYFFVPELSVVRRMRRSYFYKTEAIPE